VEGDVRLYDSRQTGEKVAIYCSVAGYEGPVISVGDTDLASLIL
jgi:hypothetical protein